MKINFYIISSLIMMQLLCFGQEIKKPNIIELKEFYDYYGVIIHPDSDLYLSYTSSLKVDKPFIPTKDEIIHGEKLLSHFLNMLCGNSSSKRLLVKVNLRSYLRNYIGYIDKNEKKLILNLLVKDFTSEDNILLTGCLFIPKSFLINLTKFEIEPHDTLMDFKNWFLRKRDKI